MGDKEAWIFLLAPEASKRGFKSHSPNHLEAVLMYPARASRIPASESKGL